MDNDTKLNTDKKSSVEPEEVVIDILDSSAEEVQKKIENTSFTSLFDQINEWLIDLTPVSTKDKFLFFQLFGSMIEAGISAFEAFSLLSEQLPNPKLQRISKDMMVLMENGTSLADAFRSHDTIFDESTCSVIEAGERSGQLTSVLQELVRQYDRLNNIYARVRSVMTYPIVVTCVMVLLSIVVLVFVIPKLENMFEGSDNLPGPTRAMIAASDFIIHKWWLGLGILVAIVSLFTVWKNSRVGNKQWSMFLLYCPVVKGIVHGMMLSQMTRIFGFLINSGVPLVDALKIVSHASNNGIVREKLLLAADDLTKGIRIAESLSGNETLFPKLLISLMNIGEQSAQLGNTMIKAAKLYEEELERRVSNLSKLMEPFVLAFLTGLALFLILAIYLPILQMSDHVL